MDKVHVNKVKVINEPTELISILTSINTELKKKVFDELSKNWCTAAQIVEKFGEEGKETMFLLEKMKMVEVRWQCASGAKPDKIFHADCSRFYINTSCEMEDVSDILSVINMPEKEFIKAEQKILDLVNGGGKFLGDVADSQGISHLKLKCLVRRSPRLDVKGQRIEKLAE